MQSVTREVHQHVGLRLRQRREALGIDRIDAVAELGVSPMDASKYEVGAVAIPPSLVIEVADFFMVDVNWFFEGAPVTEPSEACQAAIRDHARFLAIPEFIELMRAFLNIPTHNDRQGAIDAVRPLSASSGNG
jgi:transcriptional regulator with XRE-family HTH domain